MGVTKLENIINPEVMGDMINAKTEAQLKDVYKRQNLQMCG